MSQRRLWGQRRLRLEFMDDLRYSEIIEPAGPRAVDVVDLWIVGLSGLKT